MSFLRSGCVRIAATSVWLKASVAVWFVCFAGAAAHAAQACHSYSYKNDDGVTEWSNSIPADRANGGYSCHDKDAKVIEVVAPKLTPQEQAQRDREKAAEKAAREAGLPRERTPEELQERYASIRDVEEARGRTIAALDASLAEARTTLDALKLRRKDADKLAAEAERQGRSPSPEVLNNMSVLDMKIATTEAEIEKRVVERQYAIEQFQMDLEGVKRLYSH